MTPFVVLVTLSGCAELTEPSLREAPAPGVAAEEDPHPSGQPFATGLGSLVIDDGGDGSESTGVDTSTSWWSASSTPGYYGSSYKAAAAAPLGDPAVFWFDTVAASCLTVEAWWTEGSNRAPAVTYIGWDGSGAEVGRAVVDQRSGGNQWNPLGSWDFPAGRNAVVLSRWTASGTFVIADAVRVTPCGETTIDPPSDTGEPADEPGVGVDLDVPYYYQYDNVYQPSSTCGLTSTAMSLSYWQDPVTPDQLYTAYGVSQGQSPSGIAQLQEWEGLYASWTTHGTRADIRAHLDAGRPVIVHGFWTTAGHIAVIVGYDERDWIVNDPAGDWYTCYGCVRADHVRYPIGGAWDDDLSWDGDVWLSASHVEPF